VHSLISQALHGPPQSTPVSPPFFSPSVHVGVVSVSWHPEAPSHSYPSEQSVPSSTVVSQSSFSPLHISVVGTHCGAHWFKVHEALHEASHSPLLAPLSHSSAPSVIPFPQTAAISRVHVLEHPSSLTMLPSSHSSPAAFIPSPQIALRHSLVHASVLTVFPSSHCSWLLTNPSPQ
jgi:hypothetical protein